MGILGHQSLSDILNYTDDKQMVDFTNNPFSVTRAADFSDEQIYEYWVDLPDGHGFQSLIKPRLEMPMLILGGKGSGKTHIMRYLSFPLQKMKYHLDPVACVQNERFIGIYVRCSGLNSTRFRGKGQSDEKWADVFAYYIELWLSQMAVDICSQIVCDYSEVNDCDGPIIAEVRSLFDEPTEDFPSSFQDLGDHLRDLQRQLDIEVNNCAVTGVLDIKIRASAGRLTFGIPRIFSSHFKNLKEILYVYLIDEYENLTGSQQKHFNTLIREKQHPCSFKIGARLYGVKTYSTFCADEDNKEGSEYEQLPLDKSLRENDKYATFARQLTIRRLTTCGVLRNPSTNDGNAREFLSSAFLDVSTEGLAEDSTRFVIEKFSDRERPYFRKLRNVLRDGLKAKVTPGLMSSSDIDNINEFLSCHDYPLLEKLNCFMLYQQWKSRRNLLDSAEKIKIKCQDYLHGKRSGTKYHDTLLHWKSDLLAQLRRECGRKQQYAGFDTLIDLSWGNPRHLLILLKHIIAWASFKGEQPFGGRPISVLAQGEGAREAAEWFFQDARIIGRDGNLVQHAIDRLCTLFRSVRYSHKPSECSLCAFSYEPAAVTEETQRIIDLAEKWSLLVNVGGQRHRNSKRVDMKFQINRMLAPRWDIPFKRRGTLAISGDEVNTIFDRSFANEFERLLRIRIDRMNAPFFGTKPRTKYSISKDQGTLFGLGNE